MKNIVESLNEIQDITPYLKKEKVDEGLKDLLLSVRDKFKEAWTYLKNVVVRVGCYFWPVDNEGKIRLNMFSHAEDQYSSYSDNGSGQRNGVGIMYQKEFNSFKELFRKKSDAEKLCNKQERERIKREKKLEKEQQKRQKELKAKN
jgi:hypothetical protein